MVAAITQPDARDLRHELRQRSSSIAPVLISSQVSSGFKLAYDDDHRLVDFSYVAGGAGDDPTVVATVADTFRDELAKSEPDHVHVCPLPPALLEAVAEDILSIDIPVSVQVHFSEIESSRVLLGDLMQAAELIFMNQDEATQVFQVNDSRAMRSAIEASTRNAAFVTDRQGVTYYSEGIWCRMKAARVDVTDPTGAGDALAGGVVGQLLRGASLETAVNSGLALAAVTICGSSSQALLPLSQAEQRLD